MSGSIAQRTARTLADVKKVLLTLQRNGEIPKAEPCLKVLANILSSRAAGMVKKPKAGGPDWWGLNRDTLAVAVTACGVEATPEQIADQVAETLAWRERELQRIGRPHLVMMRPDTIGRMLGINEEIRREAEACSVGTIDGSPEQRKAARKERDRVRKRDDRRSKGVQPRPKVSQEKAKPWKAAGCSRPTWFRLQAEGRETTVSTANKVRLECPRLENLQPIRARETGKSTAYIPSTSGFGIADQGKDQSLCAPNIFPSGIRAQALASLLWSTPASEAGGEIDQPTREENSEAGWAQATADSNGGRDASQDDPALDGLAREWRDGVSRLSETGVHPDFGSWWPVILADAERFLADWATKAARLGWATRDLFGVHRVAPAARHDCKGLVAALHGGRIEALTSRAATIHTVSGTVQSFQRGGGIPAETALLWESGEAAMLRGPVAENDTAPPPDSAADGDLYDAWAREAGELVAAPHTFRPKPNEGNRYATWH